MSTRIWPLLASRALLALVFGLLTIAWPGVTLFVLVVLFGAWCLVDGVSRLVGVIRSGRDNPRRWAEIFGAVSSTGIGVITLVWPDVTAVALTLLIAAWAILIGVSEVATAIRWRKVLIGEWVLIVAGVVSVLFGIVLALAPVPGALALSLMIGFYAVVYAGVLAVLALQVRRWEHGDAPVMTGSATAAR